jgi:hypothetical protein
MTSRKFGALIMVASLLALIVSVYTGFERAATERCQARVNDALISSQRARSDAASQDRDSIDRLVAAVAEARESGQVRDALAKYRSDRAAADEDRRQHPLPAPPSEVCD